MDQFTKEGRKLRPRKTAAQRQPNFEKVEYSRGEFSGEHKPRQFGERRSYGENRGGYGDRRSGGYGQNRGGYGDRRESRGGYSSDRGGYRGGESSYGRRPEGERRPYGERGPRQFGERRNFGENRGGYGERRSGGYQDRRPRQTDGEHGSYGDRRPRQYGERRQGHQNQSLHTTYIPRIKGLNILHLSVLYNFSYSDFINHLCKDWLMII